MRQTFLVLLAIPLAGPAAERSVKVTSPLYFLPPVKSVVVTRTGDPGPDQPKHAAVASIPSLKEAVRLGGDGPFDVWFVPRDGKPIRAVVALKGAEIGAEIKLNDYLGVINFRGEGQPRGSLLVTPYDDPGPELKGHVVVQTAADTRAEMAVPPGDFAIWVVPATGARARRVVDRVRVLAGKTATVD